MLTRHIVVNTAQYVDIKLLSRTPKADMLLFVRYILIRETWSHASNKPDDSSPVRTENAHWIYGPKGHAHLSAVWRGF